MAKKLPPDAFDFYFSLGPPRSYQAVADRYGVSKRAVTDLAKREGWQKRLLDLEAKAREASDRKKLETLEAMNERHLKVARFLQSKAIETLQAMPLQTAMDAVRALDLGFRQERLIFGEPSDRTAFSIEETIKREYERWMVAGDPDQDDQGPGGHGGDSDAGGSPEGGRGLKERPVEDPGEGAPPCAP